ncbi:MAG: APC family permease [Bacteroidia bacterium]|nr:MAG: APC family permease [Bacteroidia bacterium]
MKKQLSLFDLTMIMVSFVIGMGIFRTPVNVAAASPTPFIYFLCWIVGGLVAFCGALTYAEIGSRLPKTGGYYALFSYAYHPSIAFGINGIILISNAASLAAVAIVGSEYLVSVLFPNIDPSWVKDYHVSVAIINILILYLINMRGLKMSAATQNILMVIKIGLILLLILPLFFVTDTPSSLQSLPIAESTPLKEYIKAFGIGLVAISFTYGGYQQTINFGEEVHQPQKTVPRSIFAGITIIISLYLLVNYAYVKVIGFEELKTSKNIASIMAGKVLGQNAEIVLSVLLFLGVLGYINGSLLSNPRVMYAMGKDNVLPKSFLRTNKQNAFYVSLSVYTIATCIIVFWAQEFDKILSFTIFLDSIGFVLSSATIFILRKKTKHLDGTSIYKMKLYPLLPIIFIIAYSFVAISIALNYATNNYAALTGIIVLMVFMAIYYLFLKKKNKVQ